MFPDTPVSLISNIAELAEENDAAEWMAFVELYTPPLENLIRSLNESLPPSDVEDLVQDVFVRLVPFLRENRLDRSRGRLRTYLAQIVRNLLIDRYREQLSRPQFRADDVRGDDSATTILSRRASAQPDPGEVFDARWRVAVRRAAIDHVLTKMAISDQSRRIYRALQGENPNLGDATPRQIADHFGVSYDVVKQVKSRLDRAVAAIEQRILMKAHV